MPRRFARYTENIICKMFKVIRGDIQSCRLAKSSGVIFLLSEDWVKQKYNLMEERRK